MESLWRLLYLLEPAPFTLIAIAVAVTFGSTFRALNYGKEMEHNRDMSEASITLDRSQALMIPVMSSLSLVMMFYLFSSISQFLTTFTAIAAASSLFFCLSPYAAYLKSHFGLTDPFVSRCCSIFYTNPRNTIVYMLFYSGCLACFWQLDTEQSVRHIYMHCICKPCASSKYQDLCNAPPLSICI